MALRKLRRVETSPERVQDANAQVTAAVVEASAAIAETTARLNQIEGRLLPTALDVLQGREKNPAVPLAEVDEARDEVVTLQREAKLLNARLPALREQLSRARGRQSELAKFRTEARHASGVIAIDTELVPELLALIDRFAAIAAEHAELGVRGRPGDQPVLHVAVDAKLYEIARYLRSAEWAAHVDSQRGMLNHPDRALFALN